jgi:uncharacterized protein (TIGR00730 family)
MKPEQMTPQHIQENIEEHISAISEELRAGFNFLKDYPKTVSIFGSARLTPNSSHYKMAERLAFRISRELKYAVITGASDGIMEAANKGAKEGGSPSLGISIKLPHEQKTNQYVDAQVGFDYFFNRKAMLTFSAEAYVFFPGGFGTLDELFSIMTLIQTRKIPRVPVILVGDDYWKPLAHYIKHEMLAVHHTISLGDENLFVVTENLDTILNIIKNAPVSNWWEIMD